MTPPLTPQERFERQQKLAAAVKQLRARQADPAGNEPINRHAAIYAEKVDRHEEQLEKLHDQQSHLFWLVIGAVVIGLVAGALGL